MSRARQVSQLIGASNTHLVSTPATFSNTVAVAASGITFNDSTVQLTAPSGFGFKNRIINGAMMVDQRNNGASVSASGNTDTRAVDRISYTQNGVGSTQTVQRVTDAPAGFSYSMSTTTASATLTSGSYGLLLHHIEGTYFDDLNWGTSSAAPITFSCWVKSSVVGTYTVFLRNMQAYTRYYISAFTISSANTWQYVTITVPGDVTGTWAGATAGALQLGINLGSGSGYATATTNAWTAGTQFTTGSSVNMFATTGTFKTTGWQLEKGTTATSFDYRPYGVEEMLCKRYYQIAQNCAGWWLSGGNCYGVVVLPVSMRVAPSAPTIVGSLTLNNPFGTNPTVTGIVGAYGSLGPSGGQIVLSTSGATGASSGSNMSLMLGSAAAGLAFSTEL